MPAWSRTSRAKKMQEMALGRASCARSRPTGRWTAPKRTGAAAAAAGGKSRPRTWRLGAARRRRLLFADLERKAPMVDNLYDVKYQDLYFKSGDDGQGVHPSAQPGGDAAADDHDGVAAPRGHRRALRGVRDGGPVRAAGGEDAHGAGRGSVERRKAFWRTAKGKAPAPIADETRPRSPRGRAMSQKGVPKIPSYSSYSLD